MKNLKCGSIEYKQAIREFTNEWWNRPFTYNDFIKWLRDNHCKVGSSTGHKEHEQAVFDSTLRRGDHVIKNYRNNGDHLETIFTVC